MLLSYQFDGNSIMSHKVNCEIDSAMRTFAEHIQQLISFAKDSGNFSHDIDELAIGIHLSGRVRCSCCLLCPNSVRRSCWCRTRYAWSSCILLLGHIRLYVRSVNRVVLLLAVCNSETLSRLLELIHLVLRGSCLSAV
jgi:hypothetical protein